MATTRLTDRFLQTFRPTTRVEIWDSVVTGLAVRVSPRGTKTFFVRPRLGQGRRLRLKIGRYLPPPHGGRPPEQPGWSLRAARFAAQELIAKAGLGIDPRPDRGATGATTFGELATDYLEHARKRGVSATTLRESQRLIARELGSWIDFPANEVTRGMVHERVSAVLDRGEQTSGRPLHATANLVVSLVSRIYRHGIAMDLVSQSPAYLVPSLTMTPRERVLTDDEVRILWSLWGNDSHPMAGVIFRLLLLTAQRTGEICALRLNDIDGRWMRIRITKNRRENMVYLSDLAQDTLAETCRRRMQMLTGDDAWWIRPTDEVFREARKIITGWLFPSPTDPESPYTGPGNVVRRLRKESGIPDWRTHDLRRTAATRMVELGVETRTVQEILNHAAQGVTAQHYLRASYRQPVKDALILWGKHIDYLTKAK